MSKPTQMSQLAEDAAGDASKRLTAALERSKEIYGQVREKAVEGVKATDQTVREHPYQAIGLAFGVGVLLGYLVVRQCSRNCDST